MKTITLLYAREDATYAQQLERQLLHTSNHGIYCIRHNDASIPGDEIAEAWSNSLYNSHLFVVLVSADLSNAPTILKYVQQANELAPDRVQAVYLRPCWVKGGKFEGVPVIPSNPITSYSGYKKEEAWVYVVQQIVSMLAQVSDSNLPVQPRQPTRTPAPVAKQHPWQQPRQEREVPPATPIERRAEKPATSSVVAKEREVQEWDCTLLYAAQDERWIPFMERTLHIMRNSIKIRFTFLKPKSIEAAVEQVQHSHLTLALISPDFLGSKWMDHYDTIGRLLERQQQVIIPVMLRDCQWHKNTVSIPRSKAIGKTGNDAAWHEVSQEIIRVLRGRYPDDIPGR
jgi:hypothetical protein